MRWPKAADVLLVAERLIRQIWRRDHAKDHDQQAIEDVHGCRVSCQGDRTLEFPFWTFVICMGGKPEDAWL